MRQCKKCLETKQLDTFVKQKECKDGYRYVCKACHQSIIKSPRDTPKRGPRPMASPGMKFCTRCKDTKQISEFYVNNASNDKASSICKVCSKNATKDYKRLKAYNLTLGDYRSMLISQDNKCGICCQAVLPLYVDHNHTTGAVRMLLCGHCNSMLGFARENPDTLIAGAAYISKFTLAT